MKTIKQFILEGDSAEEALLKAFSKWHTDEHEKWDRKHGSMKEAIDDDTTGRDYLFYKRDFESKPPSKEELDKSPTVKARRAFEKYKERSHDEPPTLFSDKPTEDWSSWDGPIKRK